MQKRQTFDQFMLCENNKLFNCVKKPELCTSPIKIEWFTRPVTYLTCKVQTAAEKIYENGAVTTIWCWDF